MGSKPCIQKNDFQALQNEIHELRLENNYLKQFQNLAQEQTSQLETLSKSVAVFHKTNTKTSQEWKKTIKRMKQAREELELLLDMMNKLKKENEALKKEIEDLKVKNSTDIISN